MFVLHRRQNEFLLALDPRGFRDPQIPFKTRTRTLQNPYP